MNFACYKPVPRTVSSARRSSLARAIAGASLLLAGVTPLLAQSLPAFLPSPVQTVSTVPSNGDVNPYGVAFVPYSSAFSASAVLKSGDVLVSNFNSSANLQGTGTTIVRIPAAGGAPTVFFQASYAQRGLSTALEITRSGLVVVGSFPSVDGTAATASAGSLLVLDANGKLLATLADPKLINGPWDSTLFEAGNDFKLFVANAISGTVSRADYIIDAKGARLIDAEVIASGYKHSADPVTFFDAPTGLVYDPETDKLYVASTLDNEVFAVNQAGTRTDDGGPGQVVFADAVHLHGPLAMAQAPNGHLLVSNNDVVNADPNQPSEIVEFTKQGAFVKQLSVDPAQGGSFGLKVQSHLSAARFAAVDDNAANLSIYTVELPQ